MGRGTTILIIDDEDLMRAMSRAVLEEHGFTVLEAGDGTDGLAKAAETPPDIVLCDIEMPGKNGFEVLKMFRENSTTSAVPFVFLTGKAERSDMRKGMDLGADDFLTKPFTAVELLSTVKSRLHHRARLQGDIEGKMEELRHNISSSVPHELRTPLTGILGFGAILKEQAGSMDAEDLKQVADHILDSGQRLQRTLEKFWKYSEIAFLARDESARKALQSEQLHKAQTVIRLSANERAGSYGRESDLHLFLSPDVCIRVHHDHLTALMDEVIDNAFKFSKAGTGVDVRCDADADGSAAVISVEDAGRGMMNEQVSRMGGFMQFDRKHHEQQGLGLGFSIARELARLYEGEVSVSSEEGKGTTVTIRLPLCPRAKG
ncbi:MAG TPA: hybrid sensor histidine kinase/response regulator [Bacteroidota bacterium]